MHPDRFSLLEALRDGADNQTLLVYADWLEEHGDESDRDRAELIRLRTTPQLDSSAAERRASELWAAHRAKWARGLAPNLAEAIFVQGVLRHVATDTANFVRAAEVLVHEPVSRARLIGSTRPILEQLAICPALACLRELILPDRPVSQAELQPLLASRYLSRLKTFRIPAATLSTPIAEAIGQAATLSGLRVLDLGQYEREEGNHRNDLRRHVGRGSSISDKGVKALADSPHLAGLEALYLNGCSLSPASARLLANSTTLTSLMRLDLGYNAIRDDGLRALLRGPLLARLTHLELYANWFTGPVIAALAGSPGVAGLELLDLSGLHAPGSGVGDDAARALASSPHLSRLEHLLLADDGIGPAGVAALARSEALPSLRTLVLDRNLVGKAGVASLAGSPLLASLAELSLKEVGLDDEDALALARSPYASDGLLLDVRDNYDLTAAAVDELLRVRFGARLSVTEPRSFTDAEFE